MECKCSDGSFFLSLSFSVPRAGGRARSLSLSLLERTLLIIPMPLVTVVEDFPPMVLRVLVSIYLSREKYGTEKNALRTLCLW